MPLPGLSPDGRRGQRGSGLRSVSPPSLGDGGGREGGIAHAGAGLRAGGKAAGVSQPTQFVYASSPARGQSRRKLTMQWLTGGFLIAVAAETLTRLWLASRQIAAMQAHRNEVPAPFCGQVALEDQQKAADYTTARAQLGRWATVVEALVKLGLTLGGGLAVIDSLWRHSGFSEPWRGACVVATVLLLLQWVGQPFSLWRTFKIEARFGFNRVSPRLYAVDLGKQWLLAVLLGG